MSAIARLPNLYLTTADYYDSDNEALSSDDISFYLELAKSVEGPVLDLCCGTGRVALPLAGQGIKVTAVDLSEPMLEILKQKMGVLSVDIKQHITVSHGDMRELVLGQKFKMIIIALRSFQVLQNVDEVAKALSTIRRHLDEGGILVIDLFKPLDDMSELEGLFESREVIDKNGRSLYRRNGTNTRIDMLEQFLYCHFEYLPVNNSGPIVSEDLRIKYYYEKEFRELEPV